MKDNFFFVGPDERATVDNWLKVGRPRGKKQIDFIKSVRAARAKVNYDFWISTVEPSISDRGELLFKEGAEVFRGLSFKAWRKKAKRFFHENDEYSDIATESELLVWYGYRIASGLISFSDGCDDSRNVGNYFDSPTARHLFEASGIRKVDEKFADGAGNTVRLVVGDDDLPVMYGGFMGDYGKNAMFRENTMFKVNSCLRRSAELIPYITSPAVVIKSIV